MGPEEGTWNVSGVKLGIGYDFPFQAPDHPENN